MKHLLRCIAVLVIPVLLAVTMLGCGGNGTADDPTTTDSWFPEDTTTTEYTTTEEEPDTTEEQPGAQTGATTRPPATVPPAAAATTTATRAATAATRTTPVVTTTARQTVTRPTTASTTTTTRPTTTTTTTTTRTGTTRNPHVPPDSGDGNPVAVTAIRITSPDPWVIRLPSENAQPQNQLSWSTTPAHAVAGRDLTFHSSNGHVAQPNWAGLVRAMGPGTATITVRSAANPNVYDTITMTVLPPL